MAIGLPNISGLFNRFLRPNYERDLANANWYFANDEVKFANIDSNLQVSLAHPILTPALLFIANLAAQAKYEVRDRKSKEVIEDHWLTKLLEQPNYFQGQIDFLEALDFMKTSQGTGIIYLKRLDDEYNIIQGSTQDIDCMYVLNPNLITYPDGFRTEMLFSQDKLSNIEIIYDKDCLNITIKLKDLIFVHDMPNIANTKNMFVSNSRLDGLHQTLLNTMDSLIAKNIILKSNGKEMISSNAQLGAKQLLPDEKEEAQRMFNLNYGLGHGKSRSFITSANVTHKNLHIALRDLGLDESVKVDGNIIYTALHIPKDIKSLEAKKTTYNNFKESLTSWVQNQMQSKANDNASKFTKIVEPHLEVVGGFHHLPIMQFVKIEKYKATIIQAEALEALLNVGIQAETALGMVDLPKNLKLDEKQRIRRATVQQGQQQPQTQS